MGQQQKAVETAIAPEEVERKYEQMKSAEHDIDEMIVQMQIQKSRENKSIVIFLFQLNS